MREEQVVLPLADRARPGADAQDDRKPQVQPTGVGADRVLVATDHLVVRIGDAGCPSNPVDDVEIDPEPHSEEHAEDQQQADLHAEQRREDLVLVD